MKRKKRVMITTLGFLAAVAAYWVVRPLSYGVGERLGVLGFCVALLLLGLIVAAAAGFTGGCLFFAVEERLLGPRTDTEREASNAFLVIMLATGLLATMGWLWAIRMELRNSLAAYRASLATVRWQQELSGYASTAASVAEPSQEDLRRFQHGPEPLISGQAGPMLLVATSENDGRVVVDPSWVFLSKRRRGTPNEAQLVGVVTRDFKITEVYRWRYHRYHDGPWHSGTHGHWTAIVAMFDCSQRHQPVMIGLCQIDKLSNATSGPDAQGIAEAVEHWLAGNNARTPRGSTN